MKVTLGRKIGLGFGAIILLTVTSTFVVLHHSRRMEHAYDYLVTHDTPVIANAHQLLKLVVDMETGQRGYVITGKDNFLEPYNLATSRFTELIDTEKRLVADNPAQVIRLERLEALVAEWQQSAARPEIQMRRKIAQADIDAKQLQEVLSAGTGKRILDEIRAVSDKAEHDFQIDGNLAAVVHLKNFLKAIVDQETGQRGFLITGRDDFLEPFEFGKIDAKRSIAKLRKILSDAHDREGTSANLDKLHQLHNKWLTEVAETEIEMRQRVVDGTSTHEELQHLIDKSGGKTIVDQIRAILSGMEDEFRIARNERLLSLTVAAGKAVIDQETGQRGYMLNGNGAFLEPFHAGKVTWRKRLNDIEILNGNAYDIAAMTSNIDRLEDLWHRWLKDAAEPEMAVRRAINKNPETIQDVAQLLQRGTGKRLLDRIRVQFEDFTSEEERLTSQRYAKATTAARRASQMAMAIALVSLCAGILIAFTISRGIVRPIRQLTAALDSVAAGDLSQEIQVSATDEIGQVSQAFNQMMGDLRLANDDRDATDSMLKESVQFADNIINSMFGMLIVISADRRIAKVNMATCNHLGYSEQQLLGRSVEMLFPTEPPQAESESYGLDGILPLNPDERRQLLDTGTISEIEQWMVKKDGSKIPVLFSGSVLNHGGRKRSGLVCVAQDITKRKEFEDRLRVAKQDADSANRSKSEFLANMSHEIRTPMTAILGFAESLLDSELSDADREQSVQTIRRNGEYLLNIINDILDLSKIEAGMMSVERVDCHVERVVSEVQSLMSVRAAAKGLSLDVSYEGCFPQVVKTDPVRLRQILTNLVGNAIKFTETGNVRIITRFLHTKGIRCLQFDVVDSGCGMTEEQKAKLFQPFTQADSTTTRRFGGTGLGLTISRRFANLLGGDLVIAKTVIGLGSTFRATITPGVPEDSEMVGNLSESPSLIDQQAANIQPPRVSLSGFKILLAEDGPDNQRLVSYILKKAGADVDVADNGEIAFKAALAAHDEGVPFDVILMDMQMPIMDGYSAVRKLRRRKYDLPIIALTAHAMTSDRQKCIDAGCDDYASKPINREELVRMIRSLGSGPANARSLTTTFV